MNHSSNDDGEQGWAAELTEAFEQKQGELVEFERQLVEKDRLLEERQAHNMCVYSRDTPCCDVLC